MASVIIVNTITTCTVPVVSLARACGVMQWVVLEVQRVVLNNGGGSENDGADHLQYCFTQYK